MAPVVDPGETSTLRWTFAVSALVGAVGAALLAVASDLPASPYGPLAGGLWPLAGRGSAPGWEGPVVPGWAVVANQGPGVGNGRLFTTLCAVAGVALLIGAWTILWRRARTDLGAGLRHLWWIVAAWVTPLLLAAPLASQDVWHYGAEGRMILDGYTGYQPSSLLGHSVWTLGVDAKWAARPSLYGPGALDLSAFFVKISGGRPWVAAECWRITVLIGLVLGAWGVHRLVTRGGGNATRAILAAVANPVVLIILVGGIHNDALMLGLTVAGVALARSGMRWWGLLLCALAVAVKPNAILALGALAWWAWGAGGRERIKAILSYAWVPEPWSLGAQLLGTDTGRPVAAIELAGTVLAVLLVLTVRRSGGWIVALGWGFAALAITNPGPQPWYLAWAVGLLACGGLIRRSERIGLVVLSVMMAGGIVPLGVLLWFEGVIALGALGFFTLRNSVRASARPPAPGPDDLSADVQEPSLVEVSPGVRG